MHSTKLAIGIAATFAVPAAVATATPDWNWLVPFVAPAPAADSDMAVHVPGSSRSFSGAVVRDRSHAVDWFPAEHPPLPAVVAGGHDSANACGFCHLPDGNGRPENSALAGLPADYIKRQVAAFADGSRRSAFATALPVTLMAAAAKATSPAALDQAAAYFSGLHYVSRVRVVEQARVAFRPSQFVYVLAPDAPQPIGNRIIEVPNDAEGFERRDPHMGYTAFVPPGSIAAGRALVASGGAAGQPCALCHGDDLRGDIAPAIAGRSPTMIVRQLVAFKAGARSDPESAPMRGIAAPLDDKAMIAIASYVATLKP